MGGNAQFTSGRGGFNEITIQSNTIQPSSTIGGSLRLNGSSGTEEVIFDNLQVKGNVTVDLGAGENRIAFGLGIGPVLFGGSLSVFVGDGRDNVQFLNATVAKNTTINLGDGADTLNVGDSVFNAFELFTGDGDDTVNLEPSFFGSQTGTRFLGVVIVDSGSGNDSLRIGTKTSANRLVKFVAKAQFRGGAGLNQFNFFDAFFAGTPQFYNFKNVV